MLGKNLDEELIDGVVVAKRVKGLLAKLVVAKSNEEILRAAGNRWSVLPYTTKLRETLQSESINRVTIVGLPCQTQFLQQMKMFPLLETDFVTKIYLIVSLFCIGTFATEPFIEFLKLRYGLDPERVTYIGLEKNSIRIEYDHEQKLVPLREVLPYVQTGCLVCPDYTGVFSDISAGLSENYPGHTVLIARNEKAMKLINEAHEKGYLEIVKAGSDVVDEVETKARGKIVRAMRYMSMIL